MSGKLAGKGLWPVQKILHRRQGGTTVLQHALLRRGKTWSETRLVEQSGEDKTNTEKICAFPARAYRSASAKVKGERIEMKQTKKQRGVFEKVPGSGAWWVRYADANGRIRREKVGNKGAAIQLYQKRKTQVLPGEKLPENFRAKPVSFGELAQDALDYSKAHKRSHKQDEYRMVALKEEFGARPADKITPQELERWLAEQSYENEWAPGTVNRFKALLSLTFRLGIDNRKIKTNTA